MVLQIDDHSAYVFNFTYYTNLHFYWFFESYIPDNSYLRLYHISIVQRH